ANNKMKTVDDNLGSIEKEYSATKDRLEKEIKEIKELSKDKEEKWAKDRKTFTDEIAHLRGQVATHKDQLASSLKDKEDVASQRDALSKEKAALEDM
ncbi:hypothetical protein A2U01_0074555, partial [Trifolium medium]|nr:hypothetical protein [Trifolium medium]